MENHVLVLILTAGLALSSMMAPKKAHAAACCGGSSSSTVTITDDSVYSLGVSVSRSTLIGDAPESGPAVFLNPQNQDTTYHYQLSASTLLTDRWQAGGAFSFADPEDARRGGMRAEDVQLQAGYEFLPEWTYNPLQPKGFAFLTLRVPTGRSVYQITEPQNSVSTGRGFYELGGEVLLTKRWDFWDAFISADGRYGFERSFDDPVTTEVFSVAPGWEAILSVGAGVHPGDFRIGTQISPQYQQAKKLRYTTGNERVTAYQLVWDTTASISYSISPEVSVTASYNDQTLLGPAVNTDLSRSVAFRIQHQILR